MVPQIWPFALPGEVNLFCGFGFLWVPSNLLRVVSVTLNQDEVWKNSA